MAIPRFVKRGLLPVLGLLAVVVLILQIRASGAVKPAAASPPSASASTEDIRLRAEGRMVAYPGAQVTVSTEVMGTIAELRVDEKSVVHKGDVIAVLDSAEQRAALHEAQARIPEAEANLRQLESDLRRYKDLSASGVVTAQKLEEVQRDYDAARARRAAAVAHARSQGSLASKSRIVAPIDGVVISRMVEPGETVAEGAPLVVIADLQRTRVEAEVDEFDAGRVSLGAPVTISAEGFPDASWRGTVEDIPDAVVDRRLRPQDPGRPVDTRVLLVKVALDEPTPLKLGQRVELEIHVPRPRQSPRQGHDTLGEVRPVASTP